MLEIEAAIRQMIEISDAELNAFLSLCHVKTFKRKAVLSRANNIANEVFFIQKGLARCLLTDNEGTEHTTHFAYEGLFIADYASFLQKTPAIYTIQAIEESDVLVMPRAAVEWGYQHLREGDKLGRAIAEYYFVYNDNRIKALYTTQPKDRYDVIDSIFPDIHNRVPQHMIASYLGITPIHLSRLKKQNRAR